MMGTGMGDAAVAAGNAAGQYAPKQKAQKQNQGGGSQMPGMRKMPFEEGIGESASAGGAIAEAAPEVAMLALA